MKITIETDSYKLVNMISRAVKRYQKAHTPGDNYTVKFGAEFYDDEAVLAKEFIKATMTEHDKK